jgi:catechol 2,3-dioxygenase-like lactoylglutathione lyase family enzyme
MTRWEAHMATFEAEAAPKLSDLFSSWRMDHAAIRVPDLDQAIAWYASKLEFRLTKSVPVGQLTFGLISSLGDGHVRLEVLAGPGAADRPEHPTLSESYSLSGWHHVGIRVDDVDATVDELRCRDVTIVSEPHDVPALGLRLAFFSDPWGNLLELIAPMRI